MRTRLRVVLPVLALTLPAMGRPPAVPPAPHEVEIVALDYGFRLPRELPAGRTVFRFVNEGRVRHELNIVLLAPGVTPEQLVTAASVPTPNPATIAALVEATVGVLFAEPGQRAPGELATKLLPGRTYSVRCIFRDSPTGPTHQMLGMHSAIQVMPEKAGPEPAVPADTIVATDYVFQRYPRTLPAGAHEFAFTNAGKQRHEAIIALLKPGVTPQQVLDSVRAGRKPEEFVDAPIGVLHSRAGTTPVGTLRAHLLPGREYVIVCNFRDTDTAPAHFTMGMWGSIRVGP